MNHMFDNVEELLRFMCSHEIVDILVFCKLMPRCLVKAMESSF